MNLLKPKIIKIYNHQYRTQYLFKHSVTFTSFPISIKKQHYKSIVYSVNIVLETSSQMTTKQSENFKSTP